jgi:hypothetical protein
MSVYKDTSAAGSPGPLTASGQVFYFGNEEKFYLAVASNLISGQASGDSVMFSIFSRKNGRTDVQVDYGTTNTTFATQYSGYLIIATVPAGASVSCRVVVSSEPFPLTVQTVSAATGTVVVSSITGTVKTDVGQGTAPTPNIIIGADDTGIAAAVNTLISDSVVPSTDSPTSKALATKVYSA